MTLGVGAGLLKDKGSIKILHMANLDTSFFLSSPLGYNLGQAVTLRLPRLPSHQGETAQLLASISREYRNTQFAINCLLAC